VLQSLPMDRDVVRCARNQSRLFIPNTGSQVAWWSAQGMAEIFSLFDESVSLRVAVHEPALNLRSVFVAPDGTSLAVLSWKGLLGCQPTDLWLRVFSIPGGQLQTKLALKDEAFSGAYEPDSVGFFSGDAKGKVLRRDLRRGVLRCEVTR